MIRDRHTSQLKKWLELQCEGLNSQITRQRSLLTMKLCIFHPSRANILRMKIAKLIGELEQAESILRAIVHYESASTVDDRRFDEPMKIGESK